MKKPGKEPSELGKRARARRLELGVSKTELARRVVKAGRQGIVIQNIRQLEDGTAQTITYLGYLAIALECDPVWLATGSEPKRTHPIIDPEVFAEAWDAMNTVIDERGLKFDRLEQLRLVIRTYEILTGGADTPDKAAREALLDLLTERQKRQEP